MEGAGEGFEVGDTLVIGSDANLTEVAKVAGKGSIILDRPLQNSYPAGTLITRVPDEYADLVPPPETISVGESATGTQRIASGADPLTAPPPIDGTVRGTIDKGPGGQADGALVCSAASLQDGRK